MHEHFVPGYCVPWTFLPPFLKRAPRPCARYALSFSIGSPNSGGRNVKGTFSLWMKIPCTVATLKVYIMHVNKLNSFVLYIYFYFFKMKIMLYSDKVNNTGRIASIY